MSTFDGQWLLNSYGKQGERPGEGPSITIEISGDRISGSAGVNRFFGKFEDGSVVAPIGTTMMAGPPELMEQERKFLELISRADDWSVEKGSLMVSDGDVAAVFARQPDQ